MADGLFYLDTREPAISTNIAAVTLSTTLKALVPPSNYPVFGGQYFGRLGKKIRLRAFGRITTVLTPGNGQFNVLWGSGADNTGTTIVSSAAFALTASQTDLSWMVEITLHCRSTGNTGTIFGTGFALFNESVATPHVLIPASAAAVSGSLDLTTASIPSLQFLRSGSTVETMQVHDFEVIAMN